MENPIVEQNKKEGHAVFAITENICAETSEFKGKQYVGIRKWFKADNGNWYRTKNGLNVVVEDFNDIAAKMDEVVEFIEGQIKGKLGKPSNPEASTEAVPY